jgi:hypothetical protein
MSLKLKVFIYRFLMAATVLLVTYYLYHKGNTFYNTPLEERFYHKDYQNLRASGFFGHGLGVIGTLIIAFGVWGYIYAKKTLRFEKYVRLKYLLEFHIFLCTIGPIMILFHTTFKFGGIVSIGFWSMVLVVASGVVGRYIYVQIPRTLSGRALTASEIQQKLIDILKEIGELIKADLNIEGILSETAESNRIKSISDDINHSSIGVSAKKKARKLGRQANTMLRRKKQLERMQKLFSYWHIFHKPFAIIMLVIVLVHIVATVLMGYTWIF